MNSRNSAITTANASGMEVRSPKNRVLAMIFCLFFGVFGVHRLYVGKFWTGLFQFFTAGGFGVWWIIDFILLLMGRFKDGEGRVLGPPENTQRRALPAGRDGSLADKDWDARVNQEPEDKTEFDDDDLLSDPLEKEFEKLEKQQNKRG